MTGKFVRTVVPDPVFGCWNWNGPTDRDGYGIVWRGRTPLKAYIAVYQDEIGEIGPGLFLDHECRNRLCVAPHHLEPVSKDENERRKNWRYRARRQSCRRGHRLNTNRVLTPQGGIVCRVCNKEASNA